MEERNAKAEANAEAKRKAEAERTAKEEAVRLGAQRGAREGYYPSPDLLRELRTW